MSSEFGKVRVRTGQLVDGIRIRKEVQTVEVCVICKKSKDILMFEMTPRNFVGYDVIDIVCEDCKENGSEARES